MLNAHIYSLPILPIKKNHTNTHIQNDSGVDVSLSKLPDPPPPTNQVYAIMQKIKNFGSLSKSLTKLAKKKNHLPGVLKHGDASTKQYENTHFYVPQEVQNGRVLNSCHTSNEEVRNDTIKTKSKSKLKNLKMPKNQDQDLYENTEFHSPPVTKFSPSKIPLPAIPTEEKPNENTKKNRKSGSSFRNFRRSSGADSNINLGSSFNGKRSTFYVSNTIDVDSGVFTGPPDGNCSQTNGTDGHSVEESSNNSTRLSADYEQRSPALRPNNPPPPPPPRAGRNKQPNVSSWYAECGVFKANSLNSESKATNKAIRNGNIASWYAEAGLYQTSGASVASSSGSSGVSTGGEGCTGDDNSHSMFLNEPLYQIYSAAKLEVSQIKK